MGLKESLPIWNSLMKGLTVNVEHLGKSSEFCIHVPWQMVRPLISSPLMVNRQE